MNARLLFVHVLSPLHAGTGQGVGVIDLPIAREKATSLPYLPGSSLKGTLRDLCSDDKARDAVFGPDTNKADDHAGSVQCSDQRLLLLPVRSLAGTFAWVTSPYILRRLKRDAQGTAITGLPADIPQPSLVEQCITVSQGCCLISSGKIFLEDLDLQLDTDSVRQQAASAWAEWIGLRVFPHEHDSGWRQMLSARFCVVHDDTLSFLLDTATEIIARIKLEDEKKTVQKGGLWYEEALPTETVLSGLIVATPVKKTEKTVDQIFQTLMNLMDKPVQFGGKATVGRGLCRLQMT